MKKIILTCIVLILLMLLTIDYYVGHKGANDGKGTATTTIPGNSAAATAAVASPVTNDESAMTNSDERSVTTTTTVRTRKHTRHTKTVVPIDQSLVVNVPDNNGGLYVIMESNPETPVTVETSKAFTGNIPVVEKKYPIKATPRHIVHFGIEGGMQQNSFDNKGTDKMLRVGFHAGVLADIAIGNHFAIQPGARYSLKGIGVHTITSSGNMDIDTKDRLSLHYVEVPLNFTVIFGKRENARVMVGAGPYVAYLVSARDKYETTVTTYNNPSARTTATGDNIPGNVKVTEGERTVAIGNDNSNNSASGAGSMRAFDWGVGGFVGVQAPGGVFIKAGAQRGLMDIQKQADGSYGSNNCNYFVSLGYLIGYRK